MNRGCECLICGQRHWTPYPHGIEFKLKVTNWENRWEDLHFYLANSPEEAVIACLSSFKEDDIYAVIVNWDDESGSHSYDFRAKSFSIKKVEITSKTEIIGG